MQREQQQQQQKKDVLNIHTDALIARFVAFHIVCAHSTSTEIIPTFCFCAELMHTLLIENTFFVYTGSH